MLRTRLRTGATGFSPASIVFTTGLWIDPSDISTGFTDSAGSTPHTASGQATGRRSDKTGNGLHLTQATAGARPIYTLASSIASDVCDGTDDGYSHATATFGADLDCFLAIKRNSTGAGVPLSDAAASVVIGAFNSAGGANGSIPGTLGAPTMWVNGSQLAGGTSVLQTTVDAALTNGVWKVLEIRNIDLSSITGLRVGLFAGSMLNADVGGLIICPAQSSGNRSKLRTWMGSRVGLTL